MYFSLLATAQDGRVDSAWIGAEHMPSGGWQWMDRSQMTWTNWETQNEGDDAAVMSGQTGLWNTKQASDQNGYICKKMRKFSNCVATTEYHHCGHSGTNERDCHG